MTTVVGVAAGLTTRQLDLLRRMAQLTPAPWVMGGYAEDALLAGTVTRPHVDVDWLFPRRELELRLAQARALGFTQFETWGEAAPGEPFYLFAQADDLKIDMGITDEADGRHLIRVHRLGFDIAGREAPAGYQVVLPDDTYDYPPVEIDGIPIRVASPLALYQLRVGIASQGSFGELSDRHRGQSRRLREAFLGGRSDAELAPPIGRIGGGP
jgi:hypothetical protein